MPDSRQNVSRRLALRTGLATGISVLPAIAGYPGVATAAGNKASGVDLRMDALISALRAIGKPGCVDAASRLATIDPNTASFDLHLRRADLDAGDARLLAGALRETNGSSGPVLRSFSASYNPALTDAGIVALAEAFPTTMAELGLVGCSIGDEGGRAILTWAQSAPGIRMVCVEANNFSAELRTRFSRLGQERPSLMVIV